MEHLERDGPHVSGGTGAKHICVIGAGPSGLAALKVISESPQFKSGRWNVVAFESREDLGGVWLPAPPTDNPPLSPIYDSLVTNLPHPIMAYPSFPFPPSTPLFPPAATVLKYLQSYANHFHLTPLIRLRTTVRTIDWDSALSKWRVFTALTGANNCVHPEESLFDLVIAANGHYRVPQYPATPGLNAWLDAGKACHSAWYRRPQGHGDNVMVVGGGPSGMDIVDELRTVCRTTFHSIPGADAQDTDGPCGLFKVRGRVVEYLSVEEGSVRFEDGSVESGIDCCILATGYQYSMPFLPRSLMELSFPPPAPPLPEKLYNSSYHIFPLAKHLFPLIPSLPPSCLAFLTLPYGVAHLPFIETQMCAVLKAFDSPDSMNLTAEADDVLTRSHALQEKHDDDIVAFGRAWHNLNDAEQLQYRNDLHQFAGGSYVGGQWTIPTWVHEVFKHKVILRKEWQELVKLGEADKLLTAASTRKTLLAFILTSKYIHDVFKHNSQSILRANCSNYTAPIQAIRLAKNILLPESVDNKSCASDGEFTMALLDQLEHNAGIVADFEDVFSAILMAPAPRVLATKFEPILQFLDDFADTEIFELLRVLSYLYVAFEWVRIANNISSRDTANRYDALRTNGKSSVFSVTAAVLLDGALKRLWQKRNIVEGTLSGPVAEAILDGTNDNPSSMLLRQLFVIQYLLTKAFYLLDWYLLRGEFALNDLCRMLGQELSRNPLERDLMKSCFLARDIMGLPSFDWANFMNAIFEIDVTGPVPWEKEDWYCSDCIMQLLTRNLRTWWRHHRMSSSNPPPTMDCRNGYSCALQIDEQHARVFNHLCEDCTPEAPKPPLTLEDREANI
ncbi:hypothetical protein NM688_g6525 [Phlebia brevispora]|uniref:Uncharacterized protein n=1 Tax=Phlebia brevispora TaxID=194682 RepID=A0ACC1SF26_9APHY|nr:hypothetical protein NM688_g6525 [Phlebia brevispora]